MAASLGDVLSIPPWAPPLTPWAPRYSCPKHGMHADWLQFKWSAKAGISDLYCLRCFADTLENLPGVVEIPDSGPTPPLIPGVPAPTVTLTVSPATVNMGGSAIITWATTNAQSAIAMGSWSGSQALSGNVSTGPLTATTTFTLTATGAGGTTSQTATVVVDAVAPTPAPTLTLTASPTTITAGQSATLTWVSANATTVTASGGWTGSLAHSGSQSTGALNTTTTYTLVAVGPGGTTAPTSVTVNVNALPVINFTVNPTSLSPGGSAQLSWTTSNVTTLTGTGGTTGWPGAKTTGVGNQSTGPLQNNTTFTLNGTGPGGTVSASVSVTVAPTFSAQVVVTAGQVQPASENQYGFAGLIGSISPATLPAGGTALGLTVISLISNIANTENLTLTTVYNATANQLNQFDSVTVTDDHGTVRTFLASQATFSTVQTPVAYCEWLWNGTVANPVMATAGKSYVFTFYKAS